MLPTTIRNLPDINSTDDQWIIWREALSKYGKKQANLLFLEAWKTRSGKGNLFTSSKANTEKLRDFLEKQSISLDKGLADYPVSFMDGVDDFFSSTFRVGKWVGIGAGVVGLLIILFILYFIATHPDTTGKLAMGYATGGASLLA